MARRSAFGLVALLAILPFVLPLSALAEPCADCDEPASTESCPPACVLCFCCGQAVSIVSVAPGAEPGLAAADSADDAVDDDRRPSADPRDVFHVPKIPSLP
jgi:hypothetical protein